MPVAQPEITDRPWSSFSPCGLPCKVSLCFRPHRGSLLGLMAALHTTPDSRATQLEPAEDGSKCDADPDEDGDEEEKGREEAEGEEEAEEVVVEEEEVATQVQEVEVEANSEDAAGADSVEEGPAKEPRLSLGTQEQLSNGSDVKSPVLQGKGRNKDPTAAEGRKRLGS